MPVYVLVVSHHRHFLNRIRFADDRANRRNRGHGEFIPVGPFTVSGLQPILEDDVARRSIRVPLALGVGQSLPREVVGKDHRVRRAGAGARSITSRPGSSWRARSILAVRWRTCSAPPAGLRSWPSSQAPARPAGGFRWSARPPAACFRQVAAYWSPAPWSSTASLSTRSAATCWDACRPEGQFGHPRSPTASKAGSTSRPPPGRRCSHPPCLGRARSPSRKPNRRCRVGKRSLLHIRYTQDCGRGLSHWLEFGW